MNISEIKYIQANITIVFVSIDYDSIRRDIIKKAFTGEEVMVSDISNNVLLVVIPNKSIQATYGNNRLTVYLPVKESLEDAAITLSEISIALIKAAPDAEMSAYGLNLDGKCTVADVDVTQHFANIFFRGREDLKSIIGADVISAYPAFSFNKSGALFTLSFSPSDNEINSFSCHCNIHFEAASMPEKTIIGQQFMKYVGYFEDILKNL